MKIRKRKGPDPYRDMSEYIKARAADQTPFFRSVASSPRPITSAVWDEEKREYHQHSWELGS